MKVDGKFEQLVATILLVMLLLGCTSLPVSSKNPPVRLDGQYDNNNYLVERPARALSRIADSIVILKTKTFFEDQDNNLIPLESKGSGIVVAGRFILTVEHAVANHEVKVSTSFGVLSLPNLSKISEETSVQINGESYPLRTILKSKTHDLALFELPPDLHLASFPFPLGNSDHLELGNYVYAVGNPLNMGINIREGIISALKAPKEVSNTGAIAGNAFMVSNGLISGDSGTPIIAIRDGRFELVGLSQGTFNINARMSWVIRINIIKQIIRENLVARGKRILLKKVSFISPREKD